MAQDDKGRDQKGGLRVKDREQLPKRPPKYRVVLHNDDFTPIDFVVRLVSQVFRKSLQEAADITLEVHNKGCAVAGIYTREIAETKRAIAESIARKNEHPLMVSMEPET